MTKTNAQRQAEYRQRHFKDIEGKLERLNMVVHVTTKRKLERLAVCYGVTQRALLEMVLETEERKVLNGMTSDEQEAYYSLRRNEPKPKTDDLKELPNQKPVTEPAKFKGVSFHKKSGKWQAHVRINGKPKHLGLFDTPEAANQAVQTYRLGHNISC
jgi:hypothetical protein